MHHYLNFIDNQWVPSDHGGIFEVDNPATGAIIASVSAASQAQALRVARVVGVGDLQVAALASLTHTGTA